MKRRKAAELPAPCNEPHSSQDVFGGRDWSCKNPCDPPRIEQTEAGPQTVAPGTPTRTIPTNGLRSKVRQKDGPLALELAEIDGRQEKLFS